MRNPVFILAAIALSWLAGQEAALAYWRSDQASAAPGQVPSFWAGDAAVRLHASEQFKARSERLTAEAQAIAAAARDVLRRTPLDVLAMRQLGVLAELRSAGSGRDQIALAERISRRDLTTELLSIDHAALQGDGNAVATIRHFDHALSVYPLAGTQLLPVVASQLGEPDVRRALTAYAGRPWLRDFAINAVEYDVPPAALVEFYADLDGRIPAAELQESAVRLVRWLLSNGQYAALATYARRLPGLSDDAFTAIGVNAATRDARFAPLSWTLLSDASISAQADGDALLVQVEPGVTAFAATRLTLLAPGKYEFVHMLAPLADTPLARVEWQVTCPEAPRRQLLQADLSQAGAGGVRRARLTIPSGCVAQFWQLRAAATASQFASAVRLSGLTLSGPQ